MYLLLASLHRGGCYRISWIESWNRYFETNTCSILGSRGQIPTTFTYNLIHINKKERKKRIDSNHLENETEPKIGICSFLKNWAEPLIEVPK